MGATAEQQAWEAYRETELAAARAILAKLGYELDEEQVHIAGERYLMTGARDVGGGGKKLVLSGHRSSDGARVVIKVSSDPAGQREIEQERAARELLHKIDFALHAFHTPREFSHSKHGAHLVSITEYIPQHSPLLTRPLDEQFFLMLRAFEEQEGVHATTSAHAATIKAAFGIANASAYLSEFERFRSRAVNEVPNDSHLRDTFARASALLSEYKTTIERYCGFITHADFVPNNLRVADHTIYLLDSASLHFGNKYESWARLLNFMIHHNRDLERALVRYVRESRGEEEALMLRLMRIYKLGFLLMYYAQSLGKTEGSLHELTLARLSFWTDVMQALVDGEEVSDERVAQYLEIQQALRSDEERARQKEMIGR